MSEPIKKSVIVMAEDDADDRLLLQDAATECKWDGELHFVENGEELMDYLQHRGKYKEISSSPSPGLIILDLNMPRKDGREALKDIKSDAELRRIPVVVLTTSHADTDVGKVYELGANSFITKPAQFEDLVTIMSTLNNYWFQTVELALPRQS
jgi:CheY-like chemotaxis protein